MRRSRKRMTGQAYLIPGIRKLTKEKKGTTLVETMVTLFLISIMMAMAANALSAATRIFVRIQKEQYAQSVLDTTMTELRTITKDASGYVKTYGLTGMTPNAKGSLGGTAIEFLTPEGYVELVSADGCPETEIRIGDNVSGKSESVPTGQLLTRYYFRNSETGKYVYQEGSTVIARAVAKVFGDGFYMGNYVAVRYEYPSGMKNGDKVTSVTATVFVYRDKNRTDEIARDTETLEFRTPLPVKANEESSITAISK